MQMLTLMPENFTNSEKHVLIIPGTMSSLLVICFFFYLFITIMSKCVEDVQIYFQIFEIGGTNVSGEPTFLTARAV